MKKILTTLVVLGLTTFSANALERSDFSVTAGIAANSAVYGASGKETNRAEDNTVHSIRKESGVFVESHQSGFIELNAGDLISIGFEHTPDSISTPENKSREGLSTEAKVSVDFNDLNSVYLKLNVPGGIYLKAGMVETDLDVKETMGSGSTYNNASTEGTILGLGYQRDLGDRGFAVRFETSYMELDDVSSNNGVAADGGSSSNGGRNQIDVSSMEGLNAKLALTFTFGN